MRWVTAWFLAVFIAAGTGFTALATELNQEEGVMPLHSAEYTRTLNRFASTDTDAAFYNPAGLAFMKRKGLHGQFSSNTLYVKRISTQKYWGLYANLTPYVPFAPVPISGGIIAKLADSYVNPLFGGLPKEYTANIIAPCLPAVDVVYNGDNWAVYFDLHVTQAAPGLTFEQGLPVLDWGALATFESAAAVFNNVAVPGPLDTEANYILRNNYAQRTEYYVAGTVGASYAFIEQLAAALGVRYIYAMGNQKIGVQNAGTVGQIELLGETILQESPWLIDTDLKGHGFGLILGLHVKPIEIIDIGIKYEYYFPMVLDKHTKKFQAPGTIVSSGQLNIFLDEWWKLPWWEKKDPTSAWETLDENIGKMNADTFKKVGKKLKVTYPQTLSMGFSIKIVEGLRAETSGEVTFKPFVDLGGRQSKWNLGYKVGQCLEWFFVKQAAVSVGYLYNDFGIEKSRKHEVNYRGRNEVDPLLSSHSVAGGFKILPIDWLDIDIGAMYMIFKKEKTDTAEFVTVQFPTLHFIRKKFDERRWSVAIGLTAHLFGGDKLKKVDEYGILLKK